MIRIGLLGTDTSQICPQSNLFNLILRINNYQRKMLSAPQFPDLKNKVNNLEEFKANLNDKK